MQSNNNKYHFLYKYGVSIIFLIFFLLLCLILIPDIGKIIPIAIIIVVIIINFFNENWLRLFLRNNNFLILFIPAYQLISEESEDAQVGTTGKYATINLFSVLLFITFGSSFLISSELFNIPKDWAQWNNYESIKNWIIVWCSCGIFYIGHTLIINFFIKYAFLSGHLTHASRNIETLVNHFDLNNFESKSKNFWNKFSSYLKNFHGQMWSGKNSEKLLQNIKDRDLGTSQWFILESAAEALEKHIIDEGQTVKIEYNSVEEYSNFLSRTMNYSSEIVLWFLDKQDFEIIFSSLIGEVFLSILENYYTNKPEVIALFDDLKDTIKCKQENRYYKPSRFFKLLYKEIEGSDFEDQNKRVEIEELLSNWVDISYYYYKWAIMFSKKENDFKFQYDELKDTILQKSQNRNSIDLNLPHLNKFNEINKPKARIVDLPVIQNDNEDGKIKTKREFLLKLYKQFSSREKTAKKETEKTSNREIIIETTKCLLSRFIDNTSFNEKILISLFKLTLKLFNDYTQYNCENDCLGYITMDNYLKNTDKNFLYKDKNNLFYYDIGIYDQNVIVTSIEHDKKREVKWALINGMELTNKLKLLCPITYKNNSYYPISLNANDIETDNE